LATKELIKKTYSEIKNKYKGNGYINNPLPQRTLSLSQGEGTPRKEGKKIKNNQNNENKPESNNKQKDENNKLDESPIKDQLEALNDNFTEEFEYVNGIPKLTVADGEYSYIKFAVDIKTQKRVVVKIATEINMGEMELQILTRIKGKSKHLMKLITTYVLNGQRVLVFPRLQEFIPTEYSTVNKIKLVLNHIMQALVILHSSKILHNDIHQKNLLVEDGNIILSDYGCAKYTDKFDRDIQCTAHLLLLLVQNYFNFNTADPEDLLPVIQKTNEFENFYDLILLMLNGTVTANQVLEHAFLQKKLVDDKLRKEEESKKREAEDRIRKIREEVNRGNRLKDENINIFKDKNTIIPPKTKIHESSKQRIALMPLNVNLMSK